MGVVGFGADILHTVGDFALDVGSDVVKKKAGVSEPRQRKGLTKVFDLMQTPSST